MSGLAGLLNCCGIKAFGLELTISFAFVTAPRMPSGPGVKISSAPKKASILRRSIDIVSGMTRIKR